jgi:hypothetical protein
MKSQLIEILDEWKLKELIKDWRIYVLAISENSVVKNGVFHSLVLIALNIG